MVKKFHAAKNVAETSAMPGKKKYRADQTSALHE